ncbi:uncharacterized protein LOC109534779 [Dendroctonus ponderosae]|uniref:Lipid-binding serum glycoprotein N-terminal domain-containing protein n=1 Tax=Dendroctonus ponderosae TaxID=77166 RepID=U4UBI6_DENPD|nr:uncharacterized protein LOC109534779 [Dendroctonus ponderosae]ERL87320.1 hypothetical protein D910_04715 [Dendroctonus ponderosae]
MKCLLVAPLLLATALAAGLAGFEPEGVAKLKQELIEQFSAVAQGLPTLASHNSLGSSEALLNDYLDLVLPDINSAISSAGFDPTSLPDEKINIGIGHVNLSQGNLTKLATIERYHNVTVSYDSDSKKVALEFILRWQDLELIYKFKSKVVLISSTGHVVANVEHLKIHLKLAFDLNLAQVEVQSLDFKHTGDIALTFTGVGVLDYIIDAMSNSFTGIFHNLILDMVKKVAMDPVEEIVEAINQILDNALRPTTTHNR